MRDDDQPDFVNDLLGGYDFHDDQIRGIIHREWRWARTIAHIYLSRMHYADLTEPTAWTHLAHVPAVQEVLVRHNVQSLDVSTMTSGLRELSQQIALYLHDYTDEAGLPCFGGIRFHSRFGSGSDFECWALFDDRMADTKPGNGREILFDDQDLLDVAHEFGLSIIDDRGFVHRP